jgi:hypothetical protein
MHAPVGRSNSARLDTWDTPESTGWLDEPAFLNYCQLVKITIERLFAEGLRSSIADQRRAMGENFDADRHCDALGSLEAEGVVEGMVSGDLTKWEPRSPRKPTDYPSYNNTLIIGRPDPRTFPTEALATHRVI